MNSDIAERRARPGRKPARKPWWRYRRVLVSGGLGLILFGVLVVDEVRNSTPQPISLTGTLTLKGGSKAFSGARDSFSSSCEGTGGYADITRGAQVVVRDPEGRTIAVGALGPGKTQDVTEYKQYNGGTVRYAWSCVFPFEIPEVPWHDFYSVEVTHRGQVTFTQAQVLLGEVHLSLGN